jgi:hypothetical protein
MVHRREFIAASGTALIGLGDLSFLSQLSPVSASEAKLDPKLVRLQPDIEPLVTLLETTPRNRLLEEVGARIRKGLSYREVLAALLLAAVRNVQPRPNVGFKFHAVLVINSAHLASLASPDSERWLPIFWALDYFKDSQAQTLKESGWRMAPVDESKVPSARKAKAEFTKAMDKWDEGASDAAVASLARSYGAQELFEIFCRYGMRDFRDIGHKAIYVANAFRTLHCIGWQYAEPVLRSLAYALLQHDGKKPSENDLPADKPYRRNGELAAKIKEDWLDGKANPEATSEMMATLRQASPDEACDQVVKLLNVGVAPQSIWDGLFDGAGELLARQPGIVALHAMTSTNALHYAFKTSADEESRKLLLLQNAAYVALFRDAMKGRGKMSDLRLDKLEPMELKKEGPEAVAEILKDVGGDKLSAARKTLTYLKENPHPEPLLDASRLMIFLKGNNSHDYKFSSAVLEDYYHISPNARASYLAASMFNLRGSTSADNQLVKRTREALKG